MTLTVADKVARLVNYATGDPYGDGEVVTNVLGGYAEPGYGSPLSDEVVIVLGNWNDKDRYVNGKREIVSDVPSRLARSLERVGAEIEWLDEWTECQGCYRAVRTQPDSYSWRSSYAECDGAILCRDCLRECEEDALSEYVNNPLRCVTWCDPAHVESFGYVKWEPSDPHTYESGWHPGQTDTPEPILDEIHAAHPDAEVVFFLDESSQFYIRFSAYYRIHGEDDE